MLWTLSLLPGATADNVRAEDWKTLSRLPADYTPTQVAEMFYTDPHGDGRVSKRRRGFLATMDDDTYRAVYEYVRGGPGMLQFVDVKSHFQIASDDGGIITEVMRHVVAWSNPKPTKVGKKDNNKPLLRQDLVPSLENCPQEHIRLAEERIGTFPWETEMQPGADRASFLLEQEVLCFTRDNIATLKSSVAKAELAQFPGGKDDADDALYARRFLNPAWRGVLDIVRRYMGAEFRHPWGETPSGKSQDGPDAPWVSICAQILNTPDIARHPSLGSPDSIADLKSVIQAWIDRQTPNQVRVTAHQEAGVDPKRSGEGHDLDNNKESCVGCSSDGGDNIPAATADIAVGRPATETIPDSNSEGDGESPARHQPTPAMMVLSSTGSNDGQVARTSPCPRRGSSIQVLLPAYSADRGSQRAEQVTSSRSSTGLIPLRPGSSEKRWRRGPRAT